MNQAKKQGKPDDWILLGALVHAVLKAGDQIQHADNLTACGNIAEAMSDFARDMGQISGVQSTEKEGVTAVTRDGRTAIVGTSETKSGAGDFAAANDDDGEPEEPSAFGFGGKVNDPLRLGRQLGGFLSQIMGMSSELDALGDRITWTDALLVGLGGGLRGEIPIPAIAAVFCRSASQIIATHLIAAQMSGRADVGMREIQVSDLKPDIRLIDFCTDKTPPEIRKVFEWLEAVPGIIATLADFISPEDIEGLGYTRIRPDVTKH